jgi:hypothetical protein
MDRIPKPARYLGFGAAAARFFGGFFIGYR